MRLVADAHLSHRFIKACLRLQPDLPIIHIAGWMKGRFQDAKDDVLLTALREQWPGLADHQRSW